MKESIIEFMHEMDETINDEVQANKAYRKFSDKALEFYDKLQATFSDEQKDWFDKFLNYEIEQDSIVLEKTFKRGVKYGVRLVAECMFD